MFISSEQRQRIEIPTTEHDKETAIQDQAIVIFVYYNQIDCKMTTFPSATLLVPCLVCLLGIGFDISNMSPKTVEVKFIVCRDISLKQVKINFSSWVSVKWVFTS